MSIGGSQGSARKQLFGSRSSRLPAHAVYLCPLVLLRFNQDVHFHFMIDSCWACLTVNSLGPTEDTVLDACLLGDVWSSLLQNPKDLYCEYFIGAYAPNWIPFQY